MNPTSLCILVSTCLFFSIRSKVFAEEIVDMPSQMKDAEDPCVKRYHVEIGETCTSVAWRNSITVDDLLLLNPGLNCSQFFAEVNLCVDKAASGRVLDDAVGNTGYSMMSRADLQANLDNSNTPAVQPDVLDTGNGR